MKEQRWYKIENNQAFIFDSGYESKSQSVSVVHVSDLQYYRSNFNLKKLWGLNMFDPKIPYMEAGKCYNYTLLKTENPKVVKRFFVSSVKAHKLINTDEVYNYSYACISWCENKVHDSLLYIWNTVGDSSHSDYYGVRNSRIEEMTNDEAAVFVKGLKNEWARKIYLTE